MSDRPTPNPRAASDDGDPFTLSVATPTLPKGGGAIRGMGEKFGADPASGTGQMRVPIFPSPGRGGVTPQLALTYDSSAGNGPFGLGWQLAQSAIIKNGYTTNNESRISAFDVRHRPIRYSASIPRAN